MCKPVAVIAGVSEALNFASKMTDATGEVHKIRKKDNQHFTVLECCEDSNCRYGGRPDLDRPQPRFNSSSEEKKNDRSPSRRPVLDAEMVERVRNGIIGRQGLKAKELAERRRRRAQADAEMVEMPVEDEQEDDVELHSES